MRLVVGLGNEGPEYRFTRHNVGFMVVDEIADRCGVRFAARGDLGRLASTATADYGGERVILAKPRTLMNRSGQAVAARKTWSGGAPKSKHKRMEQTIFGFYPLNRALPSTLAFVAAFVAVRQRLRQRCPAAAGRNVPCLVVSVSAARLRL